MNINMILYNQIVQLVKSLRKIEHNSCDDGFYACPLSPEYMGKNKVCNCGLEANNAVVDKILENLEHIKKLIS
ncbi:MAG: hypothetical protein WC677_07625 [Clostridia bacterium]|jgi:hypothetical protein